ncbi:MAG: hypothetical protein Q8N81_04205 [bacterium]|nr:hypothetical protein [bacterium]
MTLDRWEQLKENIKRRFKVLEESAGDLIVGTADGDIKQGEREVLEVQTPVGKIRLLCEIRPVVLEKKLHYSHRQGQSSQAEYKFSETEKTCKLRLLRWNELEDDWQEIDEQNLSGMI